MHQTFFCLWKSSSKREEKEEAIISLRKLIPLLEETECVIVVFLLTPYSHPVLNKSIKMFTGNILPSSSSSFWNLPLPYVDFSIKLLEMTGEFIPSSILNLNNLIIKYTNISCHNLHQRNSFDFFLANNF